MSNSSKAVSRGAATLIVIALILIVGFAVFLDTTLNTPKITTCCAVTSSVTPSTSLSNLTTSSITSCFQSAESEIYLTVQNDSSGVALEGVQVTGSVKWLCGSYTPPGYFVASQSIGTLSTPSDGTVFIGSIIGNYSLTLQYSGHSFNANFGVGAEQNVNVAIGLPSDTISEIGCTLLGHTCFNETNPSSVTMITTASSSSPTIAQSLVSCLMEVPQNSVFGEYYNSTAQGTTVTYSNGTEDFFPLNSCPVPVTPQNYQVDSTIEANPRSFRT